MILKVKNIFLAALLMLIGLSAYANASQSTTQEFQNSYRLRPLDVLVMRVFQEPDLETTYKIGANGYIVLPLINAVKVGGLTLQDAQQRIKELYEKDYLVKAEVSLYIAEYCPMRVYVTGQVNRPGEVLFPPEEPMTLKKAIAMAAGATRLANMRGVIVKRKLPDGSIKVYDIDYKAILSDREAKDFPIFDGDTVEVPEGIF